MTAPAPSARLARSRLRWEDVVLLLWLVLRPLVVPDRPHDAPLPGYDPLGGLFDLVGLCAAAAGIFARRRDGTQTGLIRNGDVAYAVGPLFGAVAFALDDTVTRLGLSGAAESVPIVLSVIASIAARLWLPPTTAVLRRVLVTPFILVTSGFFSEVLSGFTDVFDLRQLGTTIGNGGLVGPLFVLVVGIVAILLFYLMLVFAPRQIAEREGTPATWAVRFGVFVIGLVLGVTLSGFVHGS